jgi:hypothetical protein
VNLLGVVMAPGFPPRVAEIRLNSMQRDVTSPLVQELSSFRHHSRIGLSVVLTDSAGTNKLLVAELFFAFMVPERIPL